MAQVIQSPGKITLPVPPASSMVFPANTPIKYRSATEIELLPELITPVGANIIFEAGPLISDPSQIDLNRNWILSQQYDASGNVIGASKNFFDIKGSLTQSQVKNLTAGKVLASQLILDGMGRPALRTLLAPINTDEFNYTENFVTSDGSNPYNYKNFGGAKFSNPDPINNTIPGTLGWYYSNNNTLEPHVPVTSIPYNRMDYQGDGTDEMRSLAGAGEVFKMGGGHEVRNYTLPVFNEASHYFQVRNKFFTSDEVGAQPVSATSLQQTVTRDANGEEVITIKDMAGKVLLTAKPGPDLTYTNLCPSSVPLLYIKVNASNPTLTGISLLGGKNFSVFDVDNNDALVTSFRTSATLNPGYYKVTNDANSPDAYLAYGGSFSDITYYFYNQLGQQIAMIPPEGVKTLIGSGLNNYTNRADIPFITQNEYDLKGRLRAITNADKGRTEFVYRKDGRVRFSQNQLQRSINAYSYINYDPFGRVIETGTFMPAGGVQFNVAGMSNTEVVDNDGGLGAGTRSDWKKSKYEVAVNTGLSDYVQDEYYLSNGISYTENSEGAQTWYNYDENSLITWMIQEVPGLGKKTIDYTHDELGKVIRMVYQKKVPSETFVHFYEYNNDQQLAAVYTNTADITTTRTLQAKYSYYIHGPLKRVELGTNVQGIDYVYTVQGWLKSINNGNRDADPGADGIAGVNVGFAKDAFGMTFDYYSGDYTRNNSGIVNTPVESTVAQEQYAGTIRNMGWHSRKPQSVINVLGAGIEAPTMYAYLYDKNNQLKAATFGTPNYGIPSFSAGNSFKEYNLNYDASGNIQSLMRTDNAGSVVDNFVYSYYAGNNRLKTVQNGQSLHGSYTYDQLGQLTAETQANGQTRYLKFNSNRELKGIYSDAAYIQPLVVYTYNETGQRISKKDFVNNTTTYYISDFSGKTLAIYSQSGAGPVVENEVPLYGAGRLGIYRKETALSEYELTDHLGNVRAVIDQNRTIKQYTDYYPFGYVMREGGTNDYRFGYQGQYSEKDKESGWNTFKLRSYDSRIGRWLTTDPKGQYHSPYLGMGNNPVNGVDPDGGTFWPRFLGFLDPRNIRQARRYAELTGGQYNEWRDENGDWVGSVSNGGVAQLFKKGTNHRDLLVQSGAGTYEADLTTKSGWGYLHFRTAVMGDAWARGAGEYGQFRDPGEPPGAMKGIAGMNPLFGTYNNLMILTKSVDVYGGAAGTKDKIFAGIGIVTAGMQFFKPIASIGRIAGATAVKSGAKYTVIANATRAGKLVDDAILYSTFANDGGAFNEDKRLIDDY